MKTDALPNLVKFLLSSPQLLLRHHQLQKKNVDRVESQGWSPRAGPPGACPRGLVAIRL